VRRHLTIAPDPIDEAALASRRQMSACMGAAVCFVGVVRDTEEGQPIRAIDYEAFQRMAEHQFELIFQELERRWPGESVRGVHPVGPGQVNEPSLWGEGVAAHPGEAFAACQFLIDEMKQRVPIWKKVVL
jgi:molybdopterin synthase catalytic subunit